MLPASTLLYVLNNSFMNYEMEHYSSTLRAQQAHAAGWKKVTDAVHREGSLIYAQLWHVGRVAHPDMPMQKGQPVAAPSAIRARGGKFRQIGNVSSMSSCRLISTDAY